MSFFGVENPKPPSLKTRRAGKPGHNMSGHTLKPKASSLRLRVMDTDSGKLITYFDITHEDGRTLTPERAKASLIKISQRIGCRIDVVIARVLLTKCRTHYREVYYSLESDNCIIVEAPQSQYIHRQNEITYILGQDDYFYRLVEDPALQAPIKRFTPFWEAEETLLAQKS